MLDEMGSELAGHSTSTEGQQYGEDEEPKEVHPTVFFIFYSHTLSFSPKTWMKVTLEAEGAMIRIKTALYYYLVSSPLPSSFALRKFTYIFRFRARSTSLCWRAIAGAFLSSIFPGALSLHPLFRSVTVRDRFSGSREPY